MFRHDWLSSDDSSSMHEEDGHIRCPKSHDRYDRGKAPTKRQQHHQMLEGRRRCKTLRVWLAINCLSAATVLQGAKLAKDPHLKCTW